MTNIMRGLLPLFAAGGAAAALAPDEAEAAVYSKDGRRLLDLLNKAASGTLDISEPPLEYHGVIPKDVFDSIRGKNPSFTSPRLGSYEDDIFHYWNAHHNHMSNEEIENAVELITNGAERYHTKGNEPYPVGIGAIGDHKAYNASLKPGEEFTRVYQINPIKKKRLLKKIEEPSGNAGWRSNTEEPSIPSSNSVEKTGLRSEHISADGVSDDSHIPAIETMRKGMLPLFAGGTAAALAPGEASASVPAEQYRWPADEPGYVNREPGLETPLVDVADFAVAPIGAATVAGRAASAAAEPFIAYGMDKAGNWLGDKLGGLLGYFGWGE